MLYETATEFKAPISAKVLTGESNAMPRSSHGKWPTP
jgi:hypothetical protein